MGELYNRFKKQPSTPYAETDTMFSEFEYNGNNYCVFQTKKRANRYSFIHCIDNLIEWEQYPVLPRIVGRMYGERKRIIQLKPSEKFITLFVVKGRPGMITGLDEGIFRSVHKFDTKYINVMSHARFKEL